MNFNWEACFLRRKGRLEKLLHMNAPDVILDRDVVLFRKAIHKTHSDFKLLLIDLRYIVYSKYIVWLVDIKVRYFKSRGLNEEEAIEKACE